LSFRSMKYRRPGETAVARQYNLVHTTKEQPSALLSSAPPKNITLEETLTASQATERQTPEVLEEIEQIVQSNPLKQVKTTFGRSVWTKAGRSVTSSPARPAHRRFDHLQEG
jgi:hypothetical protein